MSASSQPVYVDFLNGPDIAALALTDAEILAAIEARDAKAAEKHMLEHLRIMDTLAFSAQPWPSRVPPRNGEPPGGTPA